MWVQPQSCYPVYMRLRKPMTRLNPCIFDLICRKTRLDVVNNDSLMWNFNSMFARYYDTSKYFTGAIILRHAQYTVLNI